MRTHPDQLTLEPERRKRKPAAALTELDLIRAEVVLAAEHADRLAGPRARPCRCERRPWPDGRGGCVKCGREVAADV